MVAYSVSFVWNMRKSKSKVKAGVRIQKSTNFTKYLIHDVPLSISNIDFHS